MPDSRSDLEQKILAAALRDGVDLGDPKQRADFMRRLLTHVNAQGAARVEPCADGLQHWQRELSAKFNLDLLWFVQGLPREPPKFALLITLYGDGKEVAAIAWDDAVAVDILDADGATTTIRATTIVEAAGKLKQITRVETIGPSLGYVLWVGRFPDETLLFAWDFRGLMATPSDVQLDNLLARLRGIGRRHPEGSRGWFARLDRERAFQGMEQTERRALLREAYEDEMVDPETRRIALRGLLQRNRRAIWDAGGSGSPYGLLQKVSTLCRAASARQEPNERYDLRDAVQVPPSDEAPDESLSEDHVRLVEEYTAGLNGRERECVRHYLYAKLCDQDLKGYCSSKALPYEAIRKAATRGLRRLREGKTAP